MSAFTAELIGTLLLVMLGTSVVANVILKGTKGAGGGWIVITTGWALAVFVGVVVAAPYSGAHLNPAVTLGFAIASKFSWELAPVYMGAQMLGAIFGASITWLVYRDHFNNTPDGAVQLAVFSTGPAIRRYTANLISEVVGTFVLIFVVFYFTRAEISDPRTPIGLGSLDALPVALLVWVIGLSLGGTTGYAINPARDLGPRIAHAILPIRGKGGSDWGYAWVPVVGPLLGAVIAALLYLGLQPGS